jgi:hypothetical protein
MLEGPYISDGKKQKLDRLQNVNGEIYGEGFWCKTREGAGFVLKCVIDKYAVMV